MSTKKIGFSALTAIIIGNIMGSGVLILPKTIGKFGIISLWSYTIAAIGFLAIGLMYAKMQIWLKCEGVHGPILTVFGRKPGQIAALLYWLSVVLGNSALFTSLFLYTGFDKISLLTCCILTSSILFLATLFNCIELSIVKLIEILVASIKMLPLVGLPLFCTYYAWNSNIDIYKIYETTTFTQGVQQTLPHTLWAFIGIETAIAMGSTVRNPERTISKAMIVAMIAIAFADILGLWTIIKLVPNPSESSAPYTELLIFTMPQAIRKFASPIIYGLYIFLILGSIYSWVFTSGIIASESAGQKLFPKFMEKKNKFGAPSNALIISSILSFLFLIFTYNEDLAAHFDTMLDFLTLITFIIHLTTNMAFFKLIRKHLTLSNICIGVISLTTNVSTIYIICTQVLHKFYFAFT